MTVSQARGPGAPTGAGRRFATALLAALLTALLMALCTACTATSGPGAPRPPGATAPGPAGRSFGVHPGLAIHAWYDAGRVGAPWIAYVHGGSWQSGTGGSPTARKLATHETSRGYQVFGIDYRLSGVARWPAQRADVAASVDWILAHAARLGIAPRRGVIVGESAGGQLAAVEAARGRFAAAVDLAGVVDPPAVLSAPFAPLREATRRYVGCAPADCPVVWRQTRAITHLGTGAPPFLVLHSVDDPVVPVGMSRTFAAQLRARGATVRFEVIPGRAHGLMLRPRVLATIDEFIDDAVA